LKLRNYFSPFFQYWGASIAPAIWTHWANGTPASTVQVCTQQSFMQFKFLQNIILSLSTKMAQSSKQA
jgi:hypothetical protein